MYVCLHVCVYVHTFTRGEEGEDEAAGHKNKTRRTEEHGYLCMYSPRETRGAHTRALQERANGQWLRIHPPKK